MKNKIVFIVGVLFAANAGYSEVPYCPVPKKDGGYVHNGPLMPKCTENDSPEIWSGSWEDLKAVVEDAKEKYGYENFTHLGRNATMLVPANWAQMQLFINRGNPEGWSKYFWDGFHVPEAKKDDDLIDAGIRSFNDRIVKYTNPSGGEVIYDKKTGKIILDEKLGTKNLGYEYTLLSNVIKEEASIVCALNPGCTVAKIVEKLRYEWNKFRSHKVMDVTKHSENDQYKYAGILFESDSDGRFYIVDGQTGKRMTKKQVEDFPTTFSDMWKDKGLVCVESDAIDIVPPKENRQSAQNASSKDGNDARKGDVAKTDADEAKDSNIHTPVDISSLNFDDESYDWCKCISPGCFATSSRVQFGCLRCGKINREYAKKAVVLEKEFKATGKDFTWFGPNAEANARKAAGSK